MADTEASEAGSTTELVADAEVELGDVQKWKIFILLILNHFSSFFPFQQKFYVHDSVHEDARWKENLTKVKKELKDGTLKKYKIPGRDEKALGKPNQDGTFEILLGISSCSYVGCQTMYCHDMDVTNYSAFSIIFGDVQIFGLKYKSLWFEIWLRTQITKISNCSPGTLRQRTHGFFNKT